MTSIHSLREQHGDVYITETPDGLIIPWMPLSIGDYFEYETKFNLGVIVPSVLEDEIFKKCVTDIVIAEGLDRLKAGTVTTVVATIMQHSGPVNAEDIQQVLEFSRQRANQIIHKMATLICQAFPAYKPDDLYKLDFPTFMLRLAQAEDRLTQAGLLTQPLSMLPTEEVKQVQKKPKVDLGKLAEEFAKQNTQPTTAQFRAAPKKPQSDKTIISKSDIQEHQVLTGTMDEVAKESMKATDKMYQRYLEFKDSSGNVIIPSHEEREAVAKKRVELNEKRYQDYLKNHEALQKKAKEEAAKIKLERANKKKK